MRVSRSKKGRRATKKPSVFVTAGLNSVRLFSKKASMAGASVLATLALIMVGLFAVAPAANAADDPGNPTPAVVSTDAPAPQDPAPVATPAEPAAPPAPEAPHSDAPAAPDKGTPAPAPAPSPAPAVVPTTPAPQPQAKVTASSDVQASSSHSNPPTTQVKVTICHRTDSVTNPYQQITVDQSAVDGVGKNDHYGEHQGPLASTTVVAQQLKDAHTKWGDIIPPLEGVHGGLNWTAEGQAIYNAGCVVTTPPVVVQKEVGVYIYPLLDATKPPSWSNSGKQIFCESKDGDAWFTTLSCTLPPQVCGAGWGYQQDKVKDWGYAGSFNWPASIQYPVDNIGWPPIYDAKHGQLSELTTVPDCTPPPVKEPVSGNVTFTDTLCYANAPVGNGAIVTLDGKTTATYTLNGGKAQALPAGTLDDSIIGQSGYPAVLHVVLTGEDGSTLVFDHTFAMPKSASDCAPPVTLIHPMNVIFNDGCGVSDDSANVPGTKDDGEFTYTDPETGTVTTYSSYSSDQGGYNVSDATTKDGVRTVQVTFIPKGGLTIAEPGTGDTYTIVTIDGTQYAQWTYTFDSTPCPLTIIPTPPAPKVIAPTCTADGSLPPLQGGDGYTAAYNRPFNGPGAYTAVYTAVNGATFKDGTTVSYDLTVAAKLTENCSTSTPTPTPTPTATTPTTTASSNGGNGGANTGLDGREPGSATASWSAGNTALFGSGALLLIMTILGSALIIRKRNRTIGEAGVENR